MTLKTIDQLDYTSVHNEDVLDLYMMVSGSSANGETDKLFQIAVGEVGYAMSLTSRVVNNIPLDDGDFSIESLDNTFGETNAFVYESSSDGTCTVFANDTTHQPGYRYTFYNVSGHILSFACPDGTIICKDGFQLKGIDRGKTELYMFASGVWLLSGDLVPNT